MTDIKENPQNNREEADESTKRSVVFLCVFVAIMGVGIADLVPKKIQGTVVEKNKDTLFVRNLKDTTKYHILTRQDNVKPGTLQAFDYILSGDTLNFYVQPCDGTIIRDIKDINSNAVAKFVKLKREQQISDSNRARIR
jgi:hypothetical protein